MTVVFSVWYIVIIIFAIAIAGLIVAFVKMDKKDRELISDFVKQANSVEDQTPVQTEQPVAEEQPVQQEVKSEHVEQPEVVNTEVEQHVETEQPENNGENNNN